MWKDEEKNRRNYGRKGSTKGPRGRSARKGEEMKQKGRMEGRMETIKELTEIRGDINEDSKGRKEEKVRRKGRRQKHSEHGAQARKQRAQEGGMSDSSASTWKDSSTQL